LAQWQHPHDPLRPADDDGQEGAQQQ
jgi:hypothetical protein